MWYITCNRIGCGVPFLFDEKFFTLVRVTLYRVTVRPGHKLLSDPLDVSLTPFPLLIATSDATPSQGT